MRNMQLLERKEVHDWKNQVEFCSQMFFSCLFVCLYFFFSLSLLHIYSVNKKMNSS